MFAFARQLAGAEEPIYGSSAIRPVGLQTGIVPYTELVREDLKWQAMTSSSVETQTFYITTEDDHIIMIQASYGNVAGMHSTYLLNLKVSYPDREAPSLWKTEQLKGWSWNDRYSVHADGISITLSPDSNSYLIKSSIEGSVQIDLKIGRVAPGFKVGSDGTSYFGTDPKKPWGTVKHAFWPRAFAEGTVTTTKGTINVKDRALYVFALQGMKPHFAAAQWNFLNFQGPKYSAVLMEFTTPASYGETKVAVGGIVTDEAILCVDGNCTTSRTDPQRDPTTDWDEPGGFLFHLKAATPGGAKVDATLNHKVESRLDRIDVLANLPGVVKKIIQGVAKTKPYLYQYCQRGPIQITVGDKEEIEEGIIYIEATFITPLSHTVKH